MTLDTITAEAQRRLILGYDVGKGYITSLEEVQKNLDIVVQEPALQIIFTEKLVEKRRIVMKQLGEGL